MASRSKVVLDNVACDICRIVPTIIFDAPTTAGPWAYMCPSCHDNYGRGSFGTVHSNTRIQPVRG